mmetsp:Transcript_6387/g.13842  ORF Transcript_6387/g.13842 Transcript_6387/m.13842 type:complete len:85 (-) Transcript_6387:85-339(-)
MTVIMTQGKRKRENHMAKNYTIPNIENDSTKIKVITMIRMKGNVAEKRSQSIFRVRHRPEMKKIGGDLRARRNTRVTEIGKNSE